MLAGTHTSALTGPGQALGSRFSAESPGPARGWAVGGAVGGAGPHQTLSNQSRHRVPGAGTDQGELPRGIGPAGGSAHVGSAGLEGGERVLELFIQKTDTSQAANA